jgi:hypothetical protein
VANEFLARTVKRPAVRLAKGVMRLNLGSWATFLVVAFCAQANAQVSRETALTNGRAAIRALRLGADTPISKSGMVRDPIKAESWLISVGSDRANVDMKRGEVSSVLFGEKHAASPYLPQVVRSSRTAIQAGRRWAKALGWKVGSRADCNSIFPPLDSYGVGDDALITAHFFGERRGYPSPAEDVYFTMSSISGHCVYAWRPTGFTFEGSKLYLSTPEAESVARRADCGALRSPLEAQYIVICGPKRLEEIDSQRARQLCASKRAILGYIACGDDKTIYIAGDTGEVLLYFTTFSEDEKDYLRRLRADPALAKAQQGPAVVRRETYQPPKPPTFEWDKARLTEAIVAAVAVILMPLAWFWWRSRSRNRAAL